MIGSLFNRLSGLAQKGILTGIDVGSYSTKVVQIRQGGAGRELLHALVLPHALSGTTVFLSTPDEERTAEEQQMVENLRQVGRDRRVHYGSVRSVISHESLYLRELVVPTMTREDLDRAVPLELEKFLPEARTKSFVSYQALQDGRLAGEMTVLAVAVDRDALQRHLDVLRHGGAAGVEAILIPPQAIAQAYRANYSIDPVLDTALADIGHARTSLALLEGMELRLARTIPFGGRDITRALARYLEMTAGEAEGVKCGGGIREFERIDFLLEAILGNLLRALQDSFQHYEYHAPTRRIARLFLSGGSSLLPGIQEILERRLGIETLLADPLGCFVNRDEYVKTCPADSTLFMSAVGAFL